MGTKVESNLRPVKQIYAIIFCCSFLISDVLQEIKWNSRRLKSLLTIGAILWVIAGAAVFVLPSQMHNLIYPLAVVIGAANTLVMLTTIGLESALVGDDLNGCTFVYGSLSFLDKIHLESPCSSSNPTKVRYRSDPLVLRRLRAASPAAAAAAALEAPLLV
uniref:Sugar transport protein-like n=1 Tax=Oryza sativa subsp. japonica TaxID=39947 RepID=Q67VV0_ORYSJ|nr:sugar transport protein-like [Oryza sativa Japonica Group]BAD37719.1 sugar transport protein-like [Oryza sativa Japonica Group]